MLPKIYMPNSGVEWINLSIVEKKETINVFIVAMLRSCDWTQVIDSGLSMGKRLEWQAYRDALRSIPDDFINPDDVIFSTEPAEE